MRMSLCTPENPRGFTKDTVKGFSTVYDRQDKGDFYYRQFKDPKQGQNTLSSAINEYMMACEQDDNPQILAKIARAYALNGQLEKAEQYCRKAFEKNPADKHVLKMLHEVQADLYFKKGDYAQSKASMKRALKYEKPWRKARLYSSMACVDMTVRVQETSSWARTIAMMMLGLGLMFYTASQPFNVLKPVVSLCLLMMLNRFASTETALKRYMKLYEKYPGLEHLSIEIGKKHFYRGNYTEAEFWFCGAIHRHPSNDEGYHYLSELYQTTGNTEELVETLQKWLRVRPNSGEIMSFLSQVLAQQPEQVEDAIKLAQSALINLKNPTQLANNYTHLGSLYSYVQSIDAAIMAYQAAITLNPEMLDTYISLGTLYYDKQEYSQSQVIFEQALTLSPDNAKILCNLGYLAWMQGNITPAMDYYQRSITLDPAYDIALNNLGVLYLDHVGNIQQAMNLFDQTLEHNPHYALCYYNKGRAYSFLGETIDAARCFQHAQSLNETGQELDNRELTERIRQLFENNETINTDM